MYDEPLASIRMMDAWLLFEPVVVYDTTVSFFEGCNTSLTVTLLE